MTYTAPTAEQLFILNDVLKAGLEDAPLVLEAAGQLAAETFAPLNRVGDKNPSRLANGKVTTPPGYKEAYKQFIDGGWNGLTAEEDHGGQGLPKALAMAVQELWQAANIGLALCGLLNQGAIEAITAHGSDEQKKKYLDKLVSGEWTGTMNLTEPQAGSDVGAVRTRAELQADGTYKIFGQKIFISYGDHDFTDNIVHLVLARIDGAPAGTKGLSLFLVPKMLENGTANDVAAVSLEHKLGQHGGPTAVMAYGDNISNGGGAIGELIGGEGGGITCMFTMMNDARLGVGIQGLGLCDRAYQQALAFAQERSQGGQAIINYPDVKRMLLQMKSQTEAARALAYSAGLAFDKGDKPRVDLLTPLVKSFTTDLVNEVTSLNIQIHGGMGFIEETGAAQHARDARVLAIYEGTNGIQANDLVFRKVLRDPSGTGGAELTRYLAEIEADNKKLTGDMATLFVPQLAAALNDARAATTYLLNEADALHHAGAASAYLRLISLVALGGMHARMALAADVLPEQKKIAKLNSARFFARHLLPQTSALLQAVEHTKMIVESSADTL